MLRCLGWGALDQDWVKQPTIGPKVDTAETHAGFPCGKDGMNTVGPASPSALGGDVMARAPWMKAAVNAGNELHYLKQPIVRHNLINLGSTAGLSGILAGLPFLAGALPWYLALGLTACTVGVVLLSVFVLVIHECSHAMFVVGSDRAKTRALNHRIGAFVGEITFTAYAEHWEKGHVAHHLHPCEGELDPQDPTPLDGADYWRLVAAHAIPGAAMLYNPSRKYGFSPKRFLGGAIVWGGYAALGALVGGWPFALGVLYGWNVVSVLNFTKKAQEHAAGLWAEPDPLMRSRTYFYPTRLLTSPFCISYHWEHHANFSVPWYLLPKYHEKVKSLAPREVLPYMLTVGTGQFIDQLNGKVRAVPDHLRGLLGDVGEEGGEGLPAAR